MIKYNVKTVNDWLYNSNPIKKLYYNGRRVYRRFVANGQPTPPTFDGKWKATYQDGHVTSAECDSSSAITSGEITKANLVSVEIGDCVTSIGYSAFINCTALTSITISSSVTTINDLAFENCRSLTNITIPDSVTSIGNSAFQSCTSLTSCTIGSGVTSIGRYVFRYCSGLTSIDIPSGVTSISNSLFEECSNLTTVTIGNSVTDIGSDAFYQCRNLKSVIIPSNVTNIQYRAFYQCVSLISVTVEAITPPTINQNYGGIFNGSTSPIYVTAQSVEAYKSADGWNSYASRIKPISEKPQ